MPSDRVSPATDARLIELSVPADIPCQLIFRMHRTVPVEVTAQPGVEFHLATNMMQFLMVANALGRVVGPRELLKSFMRIGVGRMFYWVRRDGVILHHGWLSVSFCRHYNVAPGAVVIGPIWTAPTARGLGLATLATQSAINELIARGMSVFYIDTSAQNHACLRMIANCGFATAIGCMPRAVG